MELTIDELNVLEVSLSSATIRVPTLESRVENGNLTSVVSVDSVSTVKNLNVLYSNVTSTDSVDTTDTILVSVNLLTVDNEVLNSRTSSSLDKTSSVSNYIVNTVNSRDSVTCTVENTCKVNSLSSLSVSEESHILNSTADYASLLTCLYPILNNLNVEYDRLELNALLSDVRSVKSSREVVSLANLKSNALDSSSLSTLVSNYVTHIESNIESNSVLLLCTCRDSKTLVSSYLSLASRGLRASIAECELCSTEVVSPRVLSPPNLVKNNSCSCSSRSVSDLNVLNVDVSVVVSKAVSESELHLREKVVESKHNGLSLTKSWSVNSNSRVEEVLSTVNVLELDSSTDTKLVSVSCVNLYISAVHRSNSSEIVLVTWSPVLDVSVSKVTLRAGNILTYEYSTSNIVHKAPYIECSKALCSCAWVESRVSTSSILNESVCEADLWVLRNIESVHCVTSYDASHSENSNKNLLHRIF